jgi:hypothetical protein
MIALHGLPFILVEYDGFRRFVASLNPMFKEISFFYGIQQDSAVYFY